MSFIFNDLKERNMTTEAEKTLQWFNNHVKNNKTYPLIAEVEKRLNDAVNAEKQVKNIAYEPVLVCVTSDLKQYIEINEKIAIAPSLATREERIKHAELSEKYGDILNVFNAR